MNIKSKHVYGCIRDGHRRSKRWLEQLSGVERSHGTVLGQVRDKVRGKVQGGKYLVGNIGK